MDDKLQEIEHRFDRLTADLGDPAVLGDPARVRDTAKERAQLEPLVEAFRELKRVREEMGISLPKDGRTVRYTGLQSRVNGNETHVSPLEFKPGAPPAGAQMPPEGQMPH